MTLYISVDLGLRDASPTFWIASDYDTGLAKVIGEQTNLTLLEIAQHTERLALKHNASEVLVNSNGIGAGVVDLLARIPDRLFEVVQIHPAGKKEAA